MYHSATAFESDFVNSAPSYQQQPQPQPQPGWLDQSLLWRVLDEIDYGLILVTPDGQLQHANHLARYELARASLLSVGGPGNQTGERVLKGRLQSASVTATADLLTGVKAAARGRRQMLVLRHGSKSLTLACVPLFQPFEGNYTSVLLMLARQNDTANLALGFFARSHKLTTAEEGVLRGLCNGQTIGDIATCHGVAESTIRTQIRALRDKTQCNSIRLLVQQIAALPPVVPVSLTVNTMTHSTTSHW